jgi:alpha-ribazole phosphatase
MLDLAALPQEFSMRLIFIRHGEPKEETQGKCYGSLDIGLSPAGQRQIEAKLAAIRNFKAEALYASPLKRALESAAVAGTLLGLETTISPELREINFGSFEGRSYQEIERLYPDEYRTWMENPTGIQFPQGESFSDVKGRVLRFKDSLLSNHPGETVVLVAHGGANRIILAEAMGIPDCMIFRIDQAYAAVNIVDYLRESPIVRMVNG